MRANKKAAWYQFQQLDGEHGYTLDHPRRNASLTHPEAHQRLIIDPGPRIVDGKEHRRARFDREGGDVYATTFPPPLKPHAIDTLGELFVETLFPTLALLEKRAQHDGQGDDMVDGLFTQESAGAAPPFSFPVFKRTGLACSLRLFDRR